MIVSEYVKGIKNNYVRIRELSLPDERKYQYCIMKRGGISGLLPFEIRYIDSDAYMYYDITSRQNLSTLYSKKALDRKWVRSFFSSMKKIRSEAVRFLLDPGNLIWNPSNVYQDLKTGNIEYLYVPYLDEDNGLSEMMDFLVSHVDYSDDELVRCVYSIAEQYKSGGDVYIQEKIYLDADELEISEDHPQALTDKETTCGNGVSDTVTDVNDSECPAQSPDCNSVSMSKGRSMDDIYTQAEKIADGFNAASGKALKLKPYVGSGSKNKGRNMTGTGGILSFWGKIRSKDKKARDEYDFGADWEASGAVAEEAVYSDAVSEEKSEGTVFVDLSSEDKVRHLENEVGKIIHELREESCVIGKSSEEADLIMDEVGISRMHARIFVKDDDYYLEDLNSTNGTFKNGLKLKPYEQKKLAKGDEIKLASKKIVFM